GRIGRRYHLVTEACELACHIGAHLVIVLDAQNRFGAAAHLFIGWRQYPPRFAAGPWQDNPEGGTLPCLASNLDGASGLLCKAEHHAEAEAAAGPHFLGRKEGIEYPVADG